MMEENTLTRGLARIPAWIVQTVTSVLLGGAVAWASWGTKATISHDSRLTSAEVKLQDSEKSLEDIKITTRHIDEKLDRLIERQANGSEARR